MMEIGLLLPVRGASRAEGGDEAAQRRERADAMAHAEGEDPGPGGQQQADVAAQGQAPEARRDAQVHVASGIVVREQREERDGEVADAAFERGEPFDRARCEAEDQVGIGGGTLQEAGLALSLLEAPDLAGAMREMHAAGSARREMAGRRDPRRVGSEEDGQLRDGRVAGSCGHEPRG